MAARVAAVRFSSCHPPGDWTTLTVVYSFTGTAGKQCGSWATPANNGTGNIYGTTYCDGANGYGNVWELSPTGGGNWSYTSLHDFTGGNDGANPISNVVMDTNGLSTARPPLAVHKATVWSGKSRSRSRAAATAN